MPFFVHESVITSTSSFFKTALVARSGQTGKNRITHLTHCDPEAFKLYLQWFYSKMIPINGSKGKNSIRSSATKCEALLLGKAYILGDRLVDATFKNLIADAFSGQSGESILCTKGCRSCLDTISYVYDDTLEPSPIRHLLVHMYSQYAKHMEDLHSGWLFSSMAEGLPKEFLLAVMRKMADPIPQSMEVHWSSDSSHNLQRMSIEAKI